MHFVLIPFATAGDILPYTGIGVGLKKRGHDVTVVTHTAFGALVRKHGLGFYDLQDTEIHARTMNDPDHWDPRTGLKKDAEFILQDSMRKQYAAVADLYVPGKTIVVTLHGGYGVR